MEVVWIENGKGRWGGWGQGAERCGVMRSGAEQRRVVMGERGGVEWVCRWEDGSGREGHESVGLTCRGRWRSGWEVLN